MPRASKGLTRPEGRLLTPARAASDARRRLERLARPARVFDASRYFRAAGSLGFLNVGTPQVRRLARALYRRQRQSWSVGDAMEFADLLIVDPRLEVKGLAVEVVACSRRDFAPWLLPRWKRWLAKGHAANWATTDAICGVLIGPLLLARPRLAAGVAQWAGHRSLWVRRASAVALIPLARRGLALDTAYGVARRLHDDREDLIQKAVGWLLREAGKSDPDRLLAHLRRQGRRMPRTTVRYAIERFRPEVRRRLLSETRQPARRRTSPARRP